MSYIGGRGEVLVEARGPQVSFIHVFIQAPCEEVDMSAVSAV